jgi:uncharacterized membrane protein YkvA (DUF1232 family)
MSTIVFIPVLGYADDAIIGTAVLRSVVRHAGIDAVRAHWAWHRRAADGEHVPGRDG